MADEYSFTPKVKLSGEFNDNKRLTPNPHDSVFGSILDISGQLAIATEASTIYLTPRARIARYTEYTEKTGDSKQERIGAAADQSRAHVATQHAHETNLPPLDSSYDAGRGLRYATPDGNLRLRLNASVQVDAAFYNPDQTELVDDLGVRRAQVGLIGILWRDWVFGTVIDVSRAVVNYQDVFLRYNGLESASFTLGQFKEPFSLEWLTTSRNITFLERGLPNVFVPPYHLGIAMESHRKNWTAAAGLFGQDIEDTDDGGKGWGASARATFAPWHEKRRVLHLGIAGAYRNLDDDNDNVRFRIRPESRLTDVRFVNTTRIRHVENYNLLGLEAATVLGPASLQGEYIRAFVDRAGSRGDPEFDGWYIYGSWFLTGESRPYVSEQGRFDRIRPKRPLSLNGGLGAWETAVRYSTLDLNDDPVRGGREDNWTVALNWYPTAYTRIMTNYIFAHAECGGSVCEKGTSEDFSIFQLRFQLEF